MKKCLIIRFGELFLKKRNQNLFVEQLINNVRLAFLHNNLQTIQIEKKFDQILLTANKREFEKLKNILQQIFGISVFYCGYQIPSSLEKLIEFVNNISAYFSLDFANFKLDIKRIDKNFIPNSLFLQNQLGNIFTKKYHCQVKLNQPAQTFYIRIYAQFILFLGKKEQGLGGLPVASTGQALVLLSGGIDSPVAAYQLMKRGLQIVYLHFYYQSQGKEKIIKITKKLQTHNNYQTAIYFVNFNDLMTEIRYINQTRYRLIILKRMFVRLANFLAKSLNIKIIATGDSLAQVASQTPESLFNIYQLSTNLVLWPLIAYNKQEIIEKAKKIGTYQLSLLKYEDCCLLFEPKNPIIKPDLKKIEELEKQIFWKELLEIIEKKQIIFEE